VLAVAMLSFAGVPPTAGFVGKYFLFTAAIGANLVWLAIIAVITSVISAYFYLRVIVTMFMQEPAAEARPLSLADTGRKIALGVTVAATILFGILPAPLLQLVNNAVLIFGTSAK
ncbi:MAG TPA: proton-conducting transporter membrane subunit, partial [Anaerolineae bacterium]